MRSATVVLLTGLAALCATEALAGQLRLRWEDNSAVGAGFIIERRTSPDDAFQEVARTSAGVNAFDDVTVEAGTPYCYRVFAFSAAGLSSPSNEACASALPFPSLPMLTFDLFSVPSGSGIIVTATLTPGALPIAVDAYIVVVLPDGSVVSIGDHGAAVLGLAPFVSGVLPTPSTAEILRYTFTGGEATGSYRWYGAVTEAGTFTVIGDMSTQAFELAP